MIWLRKRFDNYHFDLKFPSIDHIVEAVLRVDSDPLLFKIDVARAFRNLRIDPRDAVKLGIKWNNAYYVDASAAFGWTHGSAAFQRTSDAISYIMAIKGFPIICYIDDYIGVFPGNTAFEAFDALYDLLKTLGLPMNVEKLTPQLRLWYAWASRSIWRTKPLALARTRLLKFCQNAIRSGLRK